MALREAAAAESDRGVGYVPGGGRNFRYATVPSCKSSPSSSNKRGVESGCVVMRIRMLWLLVKGEGTFLRGRRRRKRKRVIFEDTGLWLVGGGEEWVRWGWWERGGERGGGFCSPMLWASLNFAFKSKK